MGRFIAAALGLEKFGRGFICSAMVEEVLAEIRGVEFTEPLTVRNVPLTPAGSLKRLTRSSSPIAPLPEPGPPHTRLWSVLRAATIER